MPEGRTLVAFEREVNKPDKEIKLGRACLVLGRFEYPHIDIDACETRISKLAADAESDNRGGELTPVALATYLFQVRNFSGNEQDYMDPRNSFLNEVIDRGLGIPISLSVLFIEVAARLQMKVQGVGLPGHFIVRADDTRGDSAQTSYIDPFHHGRLMTQQDCRERVRALTNDTIPFDAAFLNPVSNRYILVRILNNLKNIYMNRKDHVRARHVVERLLVLNPNNLDEARNLGLLHASLGESRRAVVMLEKYLRGQPDAPDADSIRKYANALASDVARWN